MYEIPVQFFPMSPERVRRTSVIDGVLSLFAIAWRRIAGPALSSSKGAKAHHGARTPASTAPVRPETAAAEAGHGAQGWRPSE
jgi:hypothetical protein